MSEQWTLRNGIFRTRRALQRTVKSVVRVTGYDVIPYYKERAYPVDFTAEHISILKKVTAQTLRRRSGCMRWRKPSDTWFSKIFPAALSSAACGVAAV